MPTVARQVPRERRGGRVVWPHRTNGRGDHLPTTLGWLGIGLGLAALTRPQAVARMVGIGGLAAGTRLLQAVGLRELASGVGILAARRPKPWLWSRVAGDAMDLGLLLRTFRQRGVTPRRLLPATATETPRSRR